MGIPCPVCNKECKTYLDLARHMVLKDRPTASKPAGEHILFLEMITGKPFIDFGWGKDKKISLYLQSYFKSNKLSSDNTKENIFWPKNID